MGTQLPPPPNPLSNGKAGKVSVGLFSLGVLLIAVFLLLDTVQWIVTGRESTLFVILARDAAGGGIVSVAGSLIVYWLKTR